MTNYEKMTEEMITLGMDKKWSRMFVKKFADDEKAFHVDADTQKWAMEHGFFPGRVELYGLDEHNYIDYVPDYPYFMMHPMNNHFRIWINDKLSLKYTLNNQTCEQVMPEYYIYIENDGSYTYLMDCPEGIPKDSHFFWNLLESKKTLAIKPNSGTSGGRGFIKLEVHNGNLLENNKPTTREAFQATLDSLKNYTITEYVHQHSELATIWPQSECTLRVIMCKDVKKKPTDEDHWTCAVSFARFGTSISGGTSNLSAGGVGVGFDYQTGEYYDNCIRYKKYCPDGNWRLDCHPDTKVGWKGKEVPNWPTVKAYIEQICLYIGSLSYLGFDIIITENGMKLCEINTHPAMDYAQVICGPTLAKPRMRVFYETKGIQRFNGEDFYQAYLRCQE